MILHTKPFNIIYKIVLKTIIIDLFTRDWIRLTSQKSQQVCKEHGSDTEIVESIQFILLDTVTDP